MRESRPRAARAPLRDRFSRRRWRGRVVRWRLPLLAGLVVAVLGAGTWAVLWSDWLDVERVRVQGTRYLDEPQVLTAAAVPAGTPLARLDLAAAEARVEVLPAVASASVTRDWPDGVEVVVREREPVAVLADDGQLQGLDGEGVLFRTYPSQPARLPLVRATDLAPELGADGRADALREVAQVVASLPGSLARQVGHVEVSSLDAIALALRDGTTVRWGSASDSAQKADVLQALLDVDAQTYDVSVPGLPTTSG